MFDDRRQRHRMSWRIKQDQQSVVHVSSCILILLKINIYSAPSVLFIVKFPMSSTDHSSTIYDIIFVGGTLLLYLSCSCADNRVRRNCRVHNCRSSCRGWSFLEDSSECQESLVHQCFFPIPKSLRSSKLVHILVMSQIIYNRHAALAAWCVPQKHLRFMWQNLVQLCVIVRWSFQWHEPLAADLAWTVRKFIFVIDAQIEIVISCLLHKGGSLRLRRLGKRIWQWRMGFWVFDTASQKG